MVDTVNTAGKAGFTGTRRGMTPGQKEAFRAVLVTLAATELHHGDCVGADADAHAVARAAGLAVYIHPPVDERLRAFCSGAKHTHPPLTHFARNRNIVDGTAVLVATPYEDAPQPRGGTWFTIDYAKKRGKPVIIIWPSGRHLEYNAEH